MESEAAEEKLDDIHSKYSLQFSGKAIVPSKDVFSKVIIQISKLMKTAERSLYHILYFVVLLDRCLMNIYSTSQYFPNI
jgi:hypothetical protein